MRVRPSGMLKLKQCAVERAGSDPESKRGCPGPRDIKRDGHKNIGETSTLDIELGQGPVSTKVQSTLG